MTTTTTAQQAGEQPSIKEHQIAALVNNLRDVAIEYRDTQQLRERIAHLVRDAFSAPHAPQSEPLTDALRLLTDAIPYRLGLIERASSLAQAQHDCKVIRECLATIVEDLAARASAGSSRGES